MYSSVTPVNVTCFHCDCSPPVLQRVLPHACILSETTTVAHIQSGFWYFTDREAVKVLNELQDEVRTEFHFALRPHCCGLCMPGVQAIQTVAPFHFFSVNCFNILGCNSFRSLKPWVVNQFLLWEKMWCLLWEVKKFCRPPENMCMDLQIWGRLRKNGQQHRNVRSQKYVQTHFYGLSEFPLWDRIGGFSRLTQIFFWYYSTEGLGLLRVLVCVSIY